MANDLGANPWIIDTPGAGVLFTHHIDVRHMEFSLYTSEFSQCIVTDQNGHVVWSATGAADLTEVKGFMRDDALVKLKVAAAQFPEFRFYLWQKGTLKPIKGAA